MSTTQTPRSPCSLSATEIMATITARQPLVPTGARMDRTNACHQARVKGFPRLHCDRVRDHGQPTDEARQAAHRRLWKAIRARGCVLLIGDRGRGKTHLGTLAACEWLAWGFSSNGQPRYWRLSDLYAEQKRWFDRKHDPIGNPVPEPLEVARTCGLLVLDEIQERQGTDWEQAELVRLLDVRYTEMRPTVLITNRTLRDVAGIVGMSAIDRMKEGGAVIECAWDNFRDRIRGGAA